MEKDLGVGLQGRIVELESIRGLAAILVFLSHVPNWNESLYQVNLIRNGGLMVELFFVLSGFVIFSNYGTKIKSLSQVAQFQFLRFGRLYPIHLTFLLVFVFFELLKYLFVANPTSVPFASGISGPREFIENLTLTQALGFSQKPDSFNGPSWSISTEFYTYLVFAFIALFLSRMQAVVHSSLLLVMAWLLLFDKSFISSFDRFITCLAGFSTGCLSAMFSTWLKTHKRAAPGSVALISAIVLVAFLSAGRRDSSTDVLITFALSATLIVAIVCGQDTRFKKVLRSWPLAKLGLLSYSIYMCHWAIIYMTDAIFKRTAIVPVIKVAGWTSAQLTPIQFVVAVMILLGTVVVVSSACYRYIEEPFRKKSRDYVGR